MKFPPKAELIFCEIGYGVFSDTQNVAKSCGVPIYPNAFQSEGLKIGEALLVARARSEPQA